MATYKLSDSIAVLGTIDPDAYATGAQNSDWCDMEYFETVLAIVMVGVMSTGGTINAKLQQATSSTGGGAADITSKAITKLTTADNDKQALINLRADELSSGFSYVRLVVTASAASGDFGALILGGHVKHGPASGHDLASVDEIVA